MDEFYKKNVQASNETEWQLQEVDDESVVD